MDIRMSGLYIGIGIVFVSCQISITNSQYSSPPFNCGGVLYSESGYISSPNYPYGYQNDMDCIWQVTSSHAPITVSFWGDIPLDNWNDRLEIRDGLYEFSQLVALFKAGYNYQPPPIYISSNNFWVRFQTGSYYGSSGWYLTFSSDGNRTTTTTIGPPPPTSVKPPTSKSPSPVNIPGIVINNNNNMLLNFFDWSKFQSWFNKSSPTR